MVVGNSNVNGCKYFVASPQGNDLDCSSRNDIYVISCTKCGVQYVGKTNKTLRCSIETGLNNYTTSTYITISTLMDIHVYCCRP